MKAATYSFFNNVGKIGFQSTPPVKAATVTPRSEREKLKISIHAAREGGDAVDAARKEVKKISIHAAREGGDGAS